MTGQTLKSPPIVLTTDFGLSDAFVGVMKGVILNINPAAVIIDLTHEVQPQDLRQGAFVLGVNHPYFPAGAIHVAVVDPGVGTARRAIVLQTPTARFVAPDNGLLSQVVKAHLPASPAQSAYSGEISLPQPLKAWELANPQYRLNPVSNTFHGRDIFAPAAAYLSLGVAPDELGPPLSNLVYRPLPEPLVSMGRVSGEVIYIDRFGNLITNIPQADVLIAGGNVRQPTVAIADRTIPGLSQTFHDANTDPITGAPAQPDGRPLVALFGSNGYLEIALRDGNAAQTLNLGIGQPVQITFTL